MFKSARVCVAVASLSFALFGCSGASNIGTGTATGGTPPTTPGGGATISVAKLTLLASAPQLSSGASGVADGVTLTAILKDADNNVVPMATVLFSTPDSAEINVVNPAVSDANGRVTATLTTGGDPQNRTVSVTASTGSGKTAVSSVIQIQVVGTTLAVSGPDSTQFDVETLYTVLLADSADAAIAGADVVVTTDAENTATLVSTKTDSSGQLIIKLKAQKPATTLTVNALGLTVSKSIVVSTDDFKITAPVADAEVNIGTSQDISTRWFQGASPVADGTVVNFAATRGSVSAGTATTTSGVAIVSITSPQAGFSTVVASSDALTKPTANIQLEFVAITPSQIEVQANPAAIAINESSEIIAVVRDVDDNLVKNTTVEFSLSDATSGNISSATAVTNSQGVAKVTFTASSQSSGSNAVVIAGKVRGTSITDSAQITVGSRAVGITIGTGAEIQSKDSSTYQLPFTVLITDSNGNPVPDAKFTLGVISLSYIKGTRSSTTATCDNEDVNRNAVLEGSEDVNGNGEIEPGPVSSVPTTVTIDADGAGQFLLTYPKDHGEFVTVQITGVATVAGTDSTEQRNILLPIAAADAASLPPNSPYGTSALCGDVN